jgi:hypothetical protein
MSKDEFKLWLDNPTTQKIRELMIESRSDYVRALCEGATLFNDSSNTQKNTAQAIGVIAGIDLFLNLQIEENNDDI